jgi:hypothetical protein
MGFRSTVNGNVKKAFALLGDLAQNVTLTRKANSGFNFATNAPIASTITASIVKGVLIKQRDDPKVGSSIQTSFMFKAADISDPTIYDTITMLDGEVWKVVPPFANDGYVITISVAKEN